jgi:hypothetical protein
MAAIDKTYTDSWEDYQEFKEWAKDKIVQLNYGKKKQIVQVSWYIYEWQKEDFNMERPIMNTPTWLDKYLKDNCPCKFVQDRLDQVYPENYVNEKKIGQIPANFQQNRKITITRTDRTSLPLRNKGITSHSNWWLFCDADLWYNKELNVWVEHGTFPSRTNCSHHKTIKSILRQLRKMYLPSGITFRLSGRYVGEDYQLNIK